jgi:hypothetical protein
MARTYMTPRKSTGWRFPSGQLAPRHRLEDVEEFQPEAEMEKNPEEVQPEREEEDPEEVEMEEEEPLEQPQLYDGTVLEADTDGDIVIPPAPVANDEAPLHMLIQCLMVKVVTRKILVMTVGMRKVVTMLMETRRKRRMNILAIMGQCITNIPRKMRMGSFAFFCGRFCST